MTDLLAIVQAAVKNFVTNVLAAVLGSLGDLAGHVLHLLSAVALH